MIVWEGPPRASAMSNQRSRPGEIGERPRDSAEAGQIVDRASPTETLEMKLAIAGVRVFMLNPHELSESIGGRLPAREAMSTRNRVTVGCHCGLCRMYWICG